MMRLNHFPPDASRRRRQAHLFFADLIDEPPRELPPADVDDQPRGRRPFRLLAFVRRAEQDAVWFGLARSGEVTCCNATAHGLHYGGAG